MPAPRTGLVSVILVNFRGADDTIEAVGHLRALDWPSDALQIVVVENGSGDDSASRIRTACPDVVLVESKTNLGFAGGCNLGVRRSDGEFIALLNNDARPDAGWVRAAIDAFGESDRIGAVASRVLDWDGKRVDYQGSALAWYGMGYKPFTGERIPKMDDEARDVLFGTGSAMFVRRSVFDDLGGFDERYFMFFEDVDLGWRLNLRGWRYRYAPASLAYHKHHASMTSFGSHKERYLLERNALYTIFKNLDDASLSEVLPAALLLSARRAVTLGGLDSTSFDLRAGGDDAPVGEFPTEAIVPLFAMDQFVENLDGLRADRAQVQAGRVVTDERIWKLFGLADAPVLQTDSYLEGYEKIVSTFDVLEPASRRDRVRTVIVTGDPIGAKLAGPAIRAWNMAEALSRSGEVTLVSLSGVDDIEAPFELVHIRPGDDRRFAPWERWADVIVFQGHAMSVFDSLRRSDKILVADIYDPLHLEQLEQARELGAAQWDRQVGDATEVLNAQLARADFFLCASERQRHFYLGQLSALGRVNPANYRSDPDLRALIDVVPFGLPAQPPVHERKVLKGVHPGIGAKDKLLLWGGGLYNWFDPATLIRATAVLGVRRPGVRLFFQGTKHPHPGVPEMEIVAQSRELAAELGVLDRLVFFNDSWVDYADRQNYLLEADAGVSTHHSHIETTFSFRTRILDYLWASLPMVVTEGDHFAELIAREGLGIAVPADDVDALADALERVLFDRPFAQDAIRNIARVREQYTWDAVLDPLVRFVRDPRPAADRVGAAARTKRSPQDKARSRKRSGIRHDALLAFFYLRNGGVAVVARKVAARVRRRR